MRLRTTALPMAFPAKKATRTKGTGEGSARATSTRVLPVCPEANNSSMRVWPRRRSRRGSRWPEDGGAQAWTAEGWLAPEGVFGFRAKGLLRRACQGYANSAPHR